MFPMITLQAMSCRDWPSLVLTSTVLDHRLNDPRRGSSSSAWGWVGDHLPTAVSHSGPNETTAWERSERKLYQPLTLPDLTANVAPTSSRVEKERNHAVLRRSVGDRCQQTTICHNARIRSSTAGVKALVRPSAFISSVLT